MITLREVPGLEEQRRASKRARRHARLAKRQIVPGQPFASNNPLVASTAAWIAPWRETAQYPGCLALLTYVSGSTPKAWEHWFRSNRRMSADVAFRLASWIETRCDAGMLLVRELREYAETRKRTVVAGRPTKWRGWLPKE